MAHPIDRTHPSYTDIHWACEALARQIEKLAPAVDLIVGLTRGGLLPAVILSHKLNIPMIPINYSSKMGKGDNKNHANELPKITQRSIVFVDDICDSGHTLQELINHYHDVPHKHTAVLYYKESAKFVPDCFVNEIPHDSPWIIFPWEV